MNLEIIKEQKVDFYTSKYISINVKQYDKSSRYILVTCCNQETFFPIDNIYNHAFVRYRKPDEKNVFNCCDITEDGKVLIELTEQMLAFVGKCFIDLVIVHNEPISPYSLSVNNGELLTNENTSIVSTMLFCINVLEAAVDNDEIESSDEYNALNDLLIKATTDYTYVMGACKISEDNAKESENNAYIFSERAKESEINAKASEEKVKESEINAKASEENAKMSEVNAKASENNAKASEVISTEKAKEVSDNLTLVKSYAVGGTNTRENENEDNAKYYYTQTKAVSDSLDGSFIPMGTIKFSELSSMPKEIGYVYHISNEFITDDTFKCGAGVYYSSGTNVYYTSDGYWDCFISKELTGDLTVTDDGNGNVIMEFAPNDTTITYNDYNKLAQTVEELRAMLEGKSILEIVE